jgi:tetratricopeptide (TPR) repeat protein/transcriptional regulator with XRE-family HTH domain
VVAVDPPVVAFAGLLRQLRTEAGLSQEELAEAAGVGARTVSDLERGVALTARKDTARRLADALNLPSEVRASFDAVARGRAAPAASPAPDGPAGGVAAATRALPRDIGSFTGRQPELRQLVGITAAVPHPGVVSIHAIGGMAGIGKTALAVHAAHQLAPMFPDGQIFLPLHGHTPGQRPVRPADALASLLQVAGVAAGQIPAGLEARTALWRDRLAGKQLLLLLDDAVGSEQVRPLLPGSAGSLVLVTSRRHLTALEDAQTLSLDTLPEEEAADLLVRLAARPGLDPAAPEVAEITRLCGQLPLAVGMLARQLHHHPAWTADGLAAELAAARDRLALLHAENLSVAAAFDLSYVELAPGQRRLFRLLGLHLGSDIDACAAAALDGTGLAAARGCLEALYDQYLIAEPARGRYRLHDLIREHARSKAAADPPAEREAATGRLLDYYQHTAALAEAVLARQSRTMPGPAAVASPPAVVPDLPDRPRALSWARAERANLLACLDYATRTGQHARVVALTAAIATLLLRDGPWTDAVARHTAAVDAARQLGDGQGEANALSDLAAIRYMTGDYRDAITTWEAALGTYRGLGDRLGEANALSDMGIVRRAMADYQGAAEMLEAAQNIYRDLGDRQGQANTLSSLGLLRRTTGDLQGAAETLEAAQGVYRDLGDRQGQANTLNYLGLVRLKIGDYRGAAGMQEAALEIFRDLGNRTGEANALSYLGEAHGLMGDYPGAARMQEAALGIYREVGNRQGEANVLGQLGVVRRLAGDYPGAAGTLEAALGTYRDLGDPLGETEALNEMGILHRLGGNLDQAGACHREALDLAREIGSQLDEAQALAGLGRCALAAGRAADARASLRQAREIFQRIGAAEAAGVAAELGTLPQPEPVPE